MSFEKLGLKYHILNPNLETRKTECFQFSANLFLSNFCFYSFLVVQASAVKPGICNLFLSYCFLMLSGKRWFSNPAFQNSCSNPYFWGVKTRVSKFGFKTDIENLKLDKLNFWSTLIGPKSVGKPDKNIVANKHFLNWFHKNLGSWDFQTAI